MAHIQIQFTESIGSIGFQSILNTLELEPKIDDSSVHQVSGTAVKTVRVISIPDF